jgi:hypothetical protein
VACGVLSCGEVVEEGGHGGQQRPPGREPQVRVPRGWECGTVGYPIQVMPAVRT